MFRDNSKVFILDGATGTELMKRGMPAGACPETWILEHPDAIRELQRAYAGATESIAKVSVAVASKIVGETLADDSEKQREIIKKYLAEVGSLHA